MALVCSCTQLSTIIGIISMLLTVESDLFLQTGPPTKSEPVIKDFTVEITASTLKSSVMPDKGMCLLCIEKTVDGFTTYENVKGEKLASCAYELCKNPEYEVCLQITKSDQLQEHRCGNKDEICGIVGVKPCTSGGSIQIYVPPDIVPTLSSITGGTAAIKEISGQGPTNIVLVDAVGNKASVDGSAESKTINLVTTADRDLTTTYLTTKSVTNFCYACRPIIIPDTIGKNWIYDDLDPDKCPNGRDDRVLTTCSKTCFQEKYNGGRDTGYYCGPSNIQLCPNTDHCQEETVTLDWKGKNVVDKSTPMPKTIEKTDGVGPLINCNNEVDGCVGQGNNISNETDNETEGDNNIDDLSAQNLTSNGPILSCNIILLAIVMCFRLRSFREGTC